MYMNTVYKDDNILQVTNMQVMHICVHTVLTHILNLLQARSVLYIYYVCILCDYP